MGDHFRHSMPTLRRCASFALVLACVAPAQAANDDVKQAAAAFQARFENPKALRESTRECALPEADLGNGKTKRVTLKVDYTEFTIPKYGPLLADQKLRVRTYNGHQVGPVLNIWPGDRLEVTIDNRLPIDEKDGDCDGHTMLPHGWNCTNLHTHGLHISPSDLADNVFREIAAKSSGTYFYDVRHDHVPGTFWYHPHKHGSVGLQVTSGMAGALIIRGGLDEIKGIKGRTERIVVFQQFHFVPDSTKTVSPNPYEFYDQLNVANETDSTVVPLVNGCIHPMFRARPDTVERWRFIHAGIEDTIKLALIKDDDKAETTEPTRIPLHEIAVDGLPRGRIVKRYEFAMQPGYRWDVLLRVPKEPGSYLLIDEATDAAASIRGKDEPRQYLAKLMVEGEAEHQDFPSDADLAACVPAELVDISEKEVGDRKCSLTFNLSQPDPNRPVLNTFKIDGEPFEPERIDRVAVLDTAEEWTLQSPFQGHPFHIHVNPFQHFMYDPDEKKNVVIWRDTVFVKENVAERIRIRYKDFDGKTVLHCHILDHEDQGMMESLMIVRTPEEAKRYMPRVLCAVGRPAPPSKVGAVIPFDLPDEHGGRHTLDEFAGRPLVLIFFRGAGCIHCIEQLSAIAARKAEFDAAGFAIVAIASEPGIPVKLPSDRMKATPFPILVDAAHDAFRVYGCYADVALHGTFVLGERGMICWEHVSSEPYRDIESLLRRAAELTNGSRVVAP